MNADDHMENRIREWIGKSRLEAPEGMSDRIMNAVNTVPKPRPRMFTRKVHTSEIRVLLKFIRHVFLFMEIFNQNLLL